MKEYNKETILRLLKSRNESDNLIGLYIIRANNPMNWGGFIMDLKNIMDGELIEADGYIKGFSSRIHSPLCSKYFYEYTDRLRDKWDRHFST